jgi:hypothetical protein
LGEGPAVDPRLALFGIEHASERGDQDLAGLGIEVAVHSDYALEGGGNVETPKLEHMLGTLFRPAMIDGIPPMGQRALEIAYRKRPRRVHERFLHTRELSRVDLVGCYQDRQGRARDLTL